MQVRPVTKVVKGMKVSEGAGVTVCRTLGTPMLRNLDPFLMLDELRCPSDQAAAGFPDHPHRGFETCSIMIRGAIEHRDSCGNHGVIRDGGVQWMTAGRGIVHSEMPKVTKGDLWGFQLWINLPKKDKMCKPRYQDYQESDIPVHEDAEMRVRVMAGEAFGKKGPIAMRNPGMLLDATVKAGGTLSLDIPEEFNAFCYVSDGSGTINKKGVDKEHTVVLGMEGTRLEAKARVSGRGQQRR